MLTVAGYFDVSGTQEDEHILVAGGALADVADWTAFDDQWGAILADNKVAHFHMKDFAHFKNDFEYGWKGAEHKRTAFLSELIRLTNERVRRLYTTTLVLRDYKAVDQIYQATETLGGPYALAVANCMLQALEWMAAEKSSNDRFQIFVEKGDIGQDAFRRLMDTYLGNIARTIQIIPKRNSNNEAIRPFDIPDFVAYEFRSEHDAFAATGKQRAKPRGALTAIRQMLDPRVGILERDVLEQMCITARIPLR